MTPQWSEKVAVRHLYIHVPFCRARCDYCDFFSLSLGARSGGEPGVGGEPAAQSGVGGERGRRNGRAVGLGSGPWPEAEVGRLLDRYLDAVLAELRLERERLDLRRLRTVFLGGGTPSLLGEERLERFLAALEPLLTPAAEVTVETNPEDVTPAYAAWAAARRLRVSLGVQSFDAGLRRALGRATAADPLAAVEELRRAGVSNLGLDLMFAIPGQDVSALRRDLAAVTRLRPEHVSWYELTLEEGTPLAARLAAGADGALAGHADRAAKPAADLAADLQRAVIGGLERAGYRWYEVSNYALSGRRCRHNSAVWRGEAYLGLGPAAVSTLGDRRRRNLPDVDAYLRALAPGAGARGAGGTQALGAPRGRRRPPGAAAGAPPAQGAPAGRPPREEEALDALTRGRERLLLAARTGARVALSEVAPVLDLAALARLAEAGFVREAGGTLWITREGRRVANEVCVRLFRDCCVEGTATCR